MTPKSWTTRAIERRRADRADIERAAEEAQLARRRRWRSIAIATTSTLATLTAFIVAGIQSTRSTAPAALALFAGCGLALVANVYLHRWLSRRVGTLTAVAVMSLGNGLLLAGATALPGQCPETSTGRCSASEVATWGVNGMLLPVVVAVLLGLPVLAGKLSINLSRFAVRRWRRNSPVRPATHTGPQPSRNLLERMRPASKRIGASARGEHADGDTNPQS